MWGVVFFLCGCAAQMPHVWWHAEGTTGYQMWASPIFNDDGSAVYVGSQDNNLYAFDTRTGKEMWRHNTKGILMTSPAYDKQNELVVIGGISGQVSAVKASGPGTPADWTVGLQSINTAPAFSPDGSIVFITTDANTLNALNATSGGMLWMTTVCDGCPTGTEVSEPLVDEEGTMVVVGGAIVGNQTKALALNGTMLWRYAGGTTRKASVFVGDMLVISDSGGVSGLNKENGTLRWRWNVDKQVRLSSAVFSLSSAIMGGANRQLLVLLGDNKSGLSIVFALNTDGTEQWRLQIEDQLLRNVDNHASFTPDGKLLLITGISGNLYGVDADGELRWSYVIPGVSIPRLLSAPICDDSTIYLAAANNSIFSLQYVPPTNKTMSIAEFIESSPDLQQMAIALSLVPDLKQLLASPGAWTFFVPSDDAMHVFSTRIGGAGYYARWLDQEAPHVFKYYTLPGVHKTFSLSSSQFMPTRLVNDTLVNLGPNIPQPLLVNIRGPEDMEVDPTVGLRATIETSDMRFSNGVIHIIDTVILPPNRSTEVLQFWKHSEFAALANQNPESIKAFDETPGVTIFAPSAEAFARASYWVKSIPRALNATLANFHVIPKLLYFSSLTDGLKLTTVTGDTLTIIANTSGTFISDGLFVAKFDPLVDRLTQTGVIHTISEVLSPVPSAVRTIGANIFFDRSLNALSELLSDASYLPFVEALSAPGNMTFFAPYTVTPRETRPPSSALLPPRVRPAYVATPSGPGFFYHLADGIRERTQEGIEFFPSRLVDPDWVQLDGKGQMIQYVRSNVSELVYGVPGNEFTVSQVLSAPRRSSNGVYVYIDQWMIPPPQVEAQLEAADLTSLGAYLKKASLMESFNTMSAVTIFASTNDAFFNEEHWAGNLAQEVLNTVLRYHVVVGPLYSTDLTNDRKLTTITGDTLIVKVDENGTKYLTSPSSDGSEVIMWDVLTSNGVIHSVSNVMSPPSNANAPLLVNMGYRKELSLVTSRIVQQPQFAEINFLLSNTNLTVTAFIPNNEGWEAVSLTDEELLNSMLYSMMNGSFPSAALDGLQFLPSLLTNTSSVRLGENESQVLQVLTDERKEMSVLFGWDSLNTTDGTAHVVDRDIHSANGILHIVDNVILVPPPALNAMNLSGLDKLASLVVRAGLQADYEKPALTIFAASDASLISIDAWARSVRPEFLALTLQYHVVEGVLYSTDLQDDDQLLTLSGDLLTVKREDNDEISLETAEGTRFPLARRDRLTANGVIHELENLIEPPPQLNLSLIDNIALQPDLFSLSKLLSLPMFAEVVKTLSGKNVTLMAPNQEALTRLANLTDLATGVVPGYYKLTLNQSLSLHTLPSSLLLSSGQTLSPTVAPTPLPTPDDDDNNSSSAFLSSLEGEKGVGQDIPGPRWPADGSPLFVETLLSNVTLPELRVGNTQSVRLDRLALPNETVYTLSSGPPLDNWTATVVRRDLKAANGFIQIIDQVLSPAVPSSAALPPMGLTEMAGLVVPGKNESHWMDREEGLTVFASTNPAIDEARQLEDLVPETVLRRQAFKGVLTVSQLRKIATATDKTKRKITMVSGDVMTVSIGSDNSVHIGATHITEGDFILSNGVLHVVDGLLVAANDNTLSVWVYVGIAAGVMFCIAAVAFFFYKRSRQTQNFDFHRIPDNKRGDSED